MKMTAYLYFYSDQEIVPKQGPQAEETYSKVDKNSPTWLTKVPHSLDSLCRYVQKRVWVFLRQKKYCSRKLRPVNGKQAEAAMAKSLSWGQPSCQARSQHVLHWQEQWLEPASDRAAGYWGESVQQQMCVRRDLAGYVCFKNWQELSLNRARTLPGKPLKR